MLKGMYKAPNDFDNMYAKEIEDMFNGSGE